MSPTDQDRAVWAAEATFELAAAQLNITASVIANYSDAPELVRRDLRAHVDRFEAAQTALREARRAQDEARRAP